MLNLIRRFLNRNKPNRGQAPDFFEVPYLRKGDSPEIALMTAEMLRSICNVRVIPGYSNPNLKTVYFDARNSKGEMWPILQLSNRTTEEAQQAVKGIVAAMNDWTNHKPIVIVVDSKSFNKAA